MKSLILTHRLRKWEAQHFLRKLPSLIEIELSKNLQQIDTSILKNSMNRVTKPLFSLFLQMILIKQESSPECDRLVEHIDIDQDGYISKEDLETFVKRSSLHLRSSKHNRVVSQGEVKLFPTEPLSEQDIEKLLRELRRIMDRRRINNYELFAKMDGNEDGFITIDEFCTGLEKIIPLPRLITEGFFAYIDKFKIGMIDLANFLKVMRKSIYVKEVVSHLLAPRRLILMLLGCERGHL